MPSVYEYENQGKNDDANDDFDTASTFRSQMSKDTAITTEVLKSFR